MTSLRWASLVMFISAEAAAETRRVAMVVGSNAGSSEVAALRFAENDAGKMARVLVELGEVEETDLFLLQGRPLRDVERAISEAKNRIDTYRRQPDTRTVLLFYFSGHSDGESLEVGRERLAYARLKALLAGTQADLRLVIIDACRSGAALSVKGARPAEPFVIKLADTLNTSGEAFISASAADEAALESSEVKGSFFTHSFISGLRGAADTSGDRQVTLSEAYRHAYEATVAATAVLPAGSQHPTSDFRLSGQGELVLTQLQHSLGSLVLPPADRGLVTDLARDQVVAEFPVGPAREVALAPGTYSVRLFKDGQAFAQRVSVADRQRLVMRWEEFAPARASTLVAAKGGGPSSLSTGVVLGLGAGVAPRALALSAGLAPKAVLRLFAEPLNSVFARFGDDGRLAGALTLAAVGDTSVDTALASETSVMGRASYRLSGN